MHSHCSKKFSCDVTCLLKASRLKSVMKKNRIICIANGNETNRYQVWLPNSYPKAKFWRSGELIHPCLKSALHSETSKRTISQQQIPCESAHVSARFVLDSNHLNNVVFVLVVLRFFLRRVADKNAWPHGQSTSRSTCLSVLLVLNELVNMAKKVNLQFKQRISA